MYSIKYCPICSQKLKKMLIFEYSKGNFDVCSYCDFCHFSFVFYIRNNKLLNYTKKKLRYDDELDEWVE